jgi:uncharacterized protein YndB with AHSA1/START domain
MDDVFRALADPTRRRLLDSLREHDGQTAGQLEAQFTMSRIGVLKHVAVLQAAGLVTTRRRGREKLHFLNVVPIQLVHDRWVSRYEALWADGLLGLRQRLEQPMEKVYEIYIRTSPARLWHAITDPDVREHFQFGCRVSSAWEPGAPVEVTHPKASGPLGDGEVIEVDPPRRLVHTLRARWSAEVEHEGWSRVTWEIEPVGDSCRLVLTHSELHEGANPELYGGWPMILSGLKTWLETGEELTTPGSLMYR